MIKVLRLTIVGLRPDHIPNPAQRPKSSKPNRQRIKSGKSFSKIYNLFFDRQRKELIPESPRKVIDEKDAESMMKNLEKGKFTVNDFMKQMDMMKNLGSMASIMKMIPGMGGVLKQVGDLSPAEDEMKRMRVIINSMTNTERDNYKLIKESRINRISKGSGTTEAQVRDFISKFRQMEKMMGGMMQMMKGGGMPGMPGMGGMPGMDGMLGMQKPKKKKKKGGQWGGFF